MDLLDKSGRLKSWYVFKMEFSLNYTFYFQWLQLVNAIPKHGKIFFKIILTRIAPSQLRIIALYKGPE